MGKEIINSMYESIKSNKGRFIGGLLGFIAAILALTIGFLKTLFIYLAVGLGGYIGKKYDDGGSIRDLFINLLNRINKEGI